MTTTICPTCGHEDGKHGQGCPVDPQIGVSTCPICGWKRGNHAPDCRFWLMDAGKKSAHVFFEKEKMDGPPKRPRTMTSREIAQWARDVLNKVR